VYYRFKLERLLSWRIDRVRQMHSLEKEVLRMEIMPSNGGRAEAVKILQKR
jgi:hypothetical protein